MDIFPFTKKEIIVPGENFPSGVFKSFFARVNCEKDYGKTALDPRMIRLSVGLEDVNDLIADLKTALDRL